MLEEVGMSSLCAVELVFGLILLGLGVSGVSIWI